LPQGISLHFCISCQEVSLVRTILATACISIALTGVAVAQMSPAPMKSMMPKKKMMMASPKPKMTPAMKKMMMTPAPMKS
jgi:hypothetical protein